MMPQFDLFIMTDEICNINGICHFPTGLSLMIHTDNTGIRFMLCGNLVALAHALASTRSKLQPGLPAPKDEWLALRNELLADTKCAPERAQRSAESCQGRAALQPLARILVSVAPSLQGITPQTLPLLAIGSASAPATDTKRLLPSA